MTAVWGVEVNEIKLLTYGGTSDDARTRWILWRSRMDRTTRIAVRPGMNPVGEVIHAECDDKGDADATRDMFIGWGIHPGIVAVKRRPADWVVLQPLASSPTRTPGQPNATPTGDPT